MLPVVRRWAAPNPVGLDCREAGRLVWACELCGMLR